MTNAAPASIPDEIIKTLSRRYARVLRFWREEDGGDVLEFYLTALMNVYDPHSDYLGKSKLDNFAMSMNLSLFGIGALLQSEDGYCKIKELKPGPAMRSKQLKPGDRIVAVAQSDGEPVEVVDMKLSKVVDMIRGPKGTEVRPAMARPRVWTLVIIVSFGFGWLAKYFGHMLSAKWYIWL